MKRISKDEYLRICGVGSAKDLSEDQILSYFLRGYGGLHNRISAIRIKQGRMFGIDIDRARGIALLREAFELGKELQVIFTEGEGVVVEGVSIGPPYLTMKFSDEEGYRWCSLDWRDEE